MLKYINDIASLHWSKSKTGGENKEEVVTNWPSEKTRQIKQKQLLVAALGCNFSCKLKFNTFGWWSQHSLKCLLEENHCSGSWGQVTLQQSFVFEGFLNLYKATFGSNTRLSHQLFPALSSECTQKLHPHYRAMPLPRPPLGEEK